MSDVVFDGPVYAANKLADFREEFGSKLPEDQNLKLREVLRQVGDPPKCRRGMEILYTNAIEHPPSTIGARKALYETLRTVATACGMGQYGGEEPMKRAWSIDTWAAYQLNPTGPEPVQPPVLDDYTTLAPIRPDPAAMMLPPI